MIFLYLILITLIYAKNINFLNFIYERPRTVIAKELFLVMFRVLAINVNMQATDVETLFSTNVASLLSMIFNFVFFDALQKHEAFTAKITQMLLFSVFWVISFNMISQVEQICIFITAIKTELHLAFRVYLQLVGF